MIWNLKLIYCNILTDNYILEYIANYRNSETSDIKLLITLFQQDDFAEKLFDCQNMDNIHIFKKFLEVSMPALAKGNFKQQMAFEPLTTVVTASEETFALLVLENNLERWIFLANKEITLASGSTREFGVTPDVKYQKKVKKRKDNRETAGRWTEQGIEYEADQRHADLLVKEMEVGEAKAVVTPIIQVSVNDAKENEEEELGQNEATRFRSIAARVNYISADRPDLQFACKSASKHMSRPTNKGWEIFKRIIK